MEIFGLCPTCSRNVSAKTGDDGDALCPRCGAPLTCDVFISCNSVDLDEAMQLATAFLSEGISHWLASDQIEPGEYFDDQICKGLKWAKVFILILSSAATRSEWVRSEIIEAKTRGIQILSLVIEDFEIPEAVFLSLNRAQRMNLFDQPFEMRVGSIIGRVKEMLGRETTATNLDEPEGVVRNAKPYLGLEPYSAEYADRLFGRERETNKLLQLINDCQIVLLHAPSGAGKSSLLDTLIRQRLALKGAEVFKTLRVGGELPKTIETDKIGNIYTFAALFGIDTKTDPEWSLNDYLTKDGHTPGTRRRVLIFDHFEEFFRDKDRDKDRARFFDELIAALNHDHQLRVILSMRKEWLADALPLEDKLPPDMTMELFALDPLREDGALLAIKMPVRRWAVFADGVAETIVRELCTIEPQGESGEPPKRREFVDMIHLQIVCESLWRSLPLNIKLIEGVHLDNAAGPGKKFSEFAANALKDFYDKTVKKVATNLTSSQNPPAPSVTTTVSVTEANDERVEELVRLIRLGCMEFVIGDSTRTLVHRTHDRTGRLPNSIIEQLHQKHLLRCEKRGDESWYELAHDRLAEVVGQEKNGRDNSVLNAIHLLEKMIEARRGANAAPGSKDGNESSFPGYFHERSEILTVCRPFHEQAAPKDRVELFLDEEEFLFRASLVVGDEMVAEVRPGQNEPEMQIWSRLLDSHSSQLREEILHEALKATLVSVRRNAAALLGLEPVTRLRPELVQIALLDPEASVRRAAAVSLARLDEPKLYAEIIERLHTPETAVDARTAMANIRVAADQKLAIEQNSKPPEDRKLPAPNFEPCFRGLGWLTRGRILLEGWTNRFEEGLPWFPVIVIPAAALAALSAALYKWLPSLFNWSLEQRTAGLGNGVFHGLTGGVMWGGSITLGLTLYYIVFERQQDEKSYWRPFGAILMGAIFGFLSSTVIVLIVVSVYEPATLEGMGWIKPGLEQFRLPLVHYPFWKALFVELRYGWVQHIIGTGMGIGMALTTNSLRSSEYWQKFLKRQKTVKGWKQLAQMIRGIMPIAVRQAWPIPLMILFSAALAFQVPDKATHLSDPIKIIGTNVSKLDDDLKGGSVLKDKEAIEAIASQLVVLEADWRAKAPPSSLKEALSIIDANLGKLRSPKAEEPIQEIGPQLEAIKAIGLQLEALRVEPANSDPSFFSRDLKAVGNSEKALRMHLIHGLIADGTSQIIGAYFAIVGMGFGIVIVRRGVTLDAWKN